MKNLFNLESPLMQMLTRVGDMILLNAMFLVCSIPVFTMGASLAALHKMLQQVVNESDTGTVKGFFKAFRANFKQATGLWLIVLLVIVSLFCDYLLVVTYFSGSEAVKWMLGLLAVLAVLVACVCVYMIPLLVRYENSLRQHLSNAIILSVIKLPRTIGLLILTFLPVIIFLLSFNVFLQTLIFWLFIGFAFTTYLGTLLLQPVFKELEGDKDKISLGK